MRVAVGIAGARASHDVGGILRQGGQVVVVVGCMGRQPCLHYGTVHACICYGGGGGWESGESGVDGSTGTSGGRNFGLNNWFKSKNNTE